MQDKLVPAHVVFDRWFIRIRWIAIVILIIATFVVKDVLQFSIHAGPIYILATILLLLNCSHLVILRYILKRGGPRVLPRIKQDIHFQIISDLVILTGIIHFSGGVENPLILFYFLHMIIASSIFSTVLSYIYAGLGLLSIGSLAVLEYLEVLPHYHLEGFVGADLYQNLLFLGGAGFVFLLTSFLVVNLTHLIITKSIKIEETYVKTNLELDNKDKLRNEYVLRVTHDIKGHLGAITSCLEVLRSGISGPMNDRQQEFVDRAGERTQLLTKFIKDLLNLTRKRLQKVQEFEEVSLYTIIDKVLATAQILAHDKSIEINSFIDKNIGPVIGNPFALEELYSNLLLNAIKYTPAKGHIELNIRNRFDHVLNEISDSGIGIPREDLPKVFDEFFRAGNAPKDIKSGSGLGLSIVKQIVEDHKGRIWVSSELGVWTRFTFTLPKNPNLVV